MGSIVWDRELAEVYDQTYRATFEPSLVANTIMNVTTQDAQLAVFANAAATWSRAGALWWR